MENDNITVHNVNPIPIMKIDLLDSEKITLEELKIIQQVSIVNNGDFIISGTARLIEDYHLDRLGKILDKYADLYIKKLIGIDNNFSRIHSWLTIHSGDTGHHKHSHNNALVAVTLYLDDELSSEPMTPLHIEIPGTDTIFQNFKFRYNIKDLNWYTWNEYILFPKTNRLFIFPAWLTHWVNKPEHKQLHNPRRICIGANYFLNDLIDIKHDNGPKINNINIRVN